jgi:hypothetical protein
MIPACRRGRNFYDFVHSYSNRAGKPYIRQSVKVPNDRIKKIIPLSSRYRILNIRVKSYTNHERKITLKTSETRNPIVFDVIV